MKFTLEQRWRAFLLNLWNNQKKAKNIMRGVEGGRCCLCVLQDTANNFGNDFVGTDSLPSRQAGEFFGFPDEKDYTSNEFAPLLQTKPRAYHASYLNDGGDNIEQKGLSHKELAILFCDKYPEDGLDDLKAYFRKRIHEFVENPSPLCFDEK